MLLSFAEVFAVAFVLSATAQAQAAGFERLTVPLTAGGTAVGGVWYPSEAPITPLSVGAFTLDVAPNAAIRGRSLPTILLSHGTGGWFGAHHDTATALADAGFVVASLTHSGDNVRDESGLIGQRRLASRPVELADLSAFMRNDWRGAGHLDPNRVGAFGYSVGGYTVVSAAGGEPNFASLRPHCQAYAEKESLCGSMMLQIDALEALAVTSPRLSFRAIVLVAPVLGVVFDDVALAPIGLDVALQVWTAGADELLGPNAHAKQIAQHWPRAVDRQAIPGAGHFVFLAPCPEAMAASEPSICRDPAGIDRAAVHRTFNDAVIRFFRSAL